MAKVYSQLQRPQYFLLLGLIGLVLTYAMATRAIDTGSLSQYGLVFLLFGLSIHMFVRAVRVNRNAQKR